MGPFIVISGSSAGNQGEKITKAVENTETCSKKAEVSAKNKELILGLFFPFMCEDLF